LFPSPPVEPGGEALPDVLLYIRSHFLCRPWLLLLSFDLVHDACYCLLDFSPRLNAWSGTDTHLDEFNERVPLYCPLVVQVVVRARSEQA